MAWAEDDLDHWWEPDFHWPVHVEPNADPDEDLDLYIELFESRGYSRCEDGQLEPGFLKIAIYATEKAFVHVARQLRCGAWSSKGGMLHDFRHEELAALEDAPYLRNAEVVAFMRREDRGDSMELQEKGLLVAGGPSGSSTERD